MAEGDNLYVGGFAALMRRLQKRQRPLEGLKDLLPPADLALGPLFDRDVPAPPPLPAEHERLSAYRKWRDLQTELTGQPEILHLHAMLIAVSRRDDPPTDAVVLFHRIWAEHGQDLIRILPVRWMISAATTFADIGQTGDQRACGMALSILFDMIKLHDSERRNSGQPGRVPFRAGNGRKRFPLAFGMPPYAFKGGDLDKVMLARLWQLCERDAVIRPLGVAMLRMVMSEPRSIFGRVQVLKNLKRGD